MKVANIYITDKTGRKGWNTSVTYGYHQGEQRNLSRHLANIKAGAAGCSTFDPATARLVIEVDGVEIDSDPAAGPSDDELLSELLG